MAAFAAAFVLPMKAQAAETKYSLANGCFAAAGLPGADQVRMQATALGRYLLYRPDRTFVALVDGAPGAAAEPSPAADWTVEPASRRRSSPSPRRPTPRSRSTVTFTPGDAAAPSTRRPRSTRPARPRKGQTRTARVRGLVEGHMHWMTYQYFGGNFHCGAPWHPYGIAYALPDCSSIEGPQGTDAPFQNFLNYGNPAQPHDTQRLPDS